MTEAIKTCIALMPTPKVTTNKVYTEGMTVTCAVDYNLANLNWRPRNY